jgi:uncharacterized membrane protein
MKVTLISIDLSVIKFVIHGLSGKGGRTCNYGSQNISPYKQDHTVSFPNSLARAFFRTDRWAYIILIIIIIIIIIIYSLSYSYVTLDCLVTSGFCQCTCTILPMTTFYLCYLL